VCSKIMSYTRVKSTAISSEHQVSASFKRTLVSGNVMGGSSIQRCPFSESGLCVLCLKLLLLPEHDNMKAYRTSLLSKLEAVRVL